MRTAGLLAGLCALSLVSDARADSFELLTYTPPPGWSTQQDGTGKMFQHKDASGAGMLVLFAGRPGGGPPAEAFAEEWRTRVQPVMPTAAPEPVSQQVGDMVVAMSRSQVPVEGQTATIVFITMVGRGRVQSVLGVARGDAITAQVAAFFDGVKIAPGPAASAPDANAALELDVEAPPGYLSRREAGGLVIVPARADPNLPCNYGVTPSRPSLGSQEADARRRSPTSSPDGGRAAPRIRATSRRDSPPPAGRSTATAPTSSEVVPSSSTPSAWSWSCPRDRSA